MNPFLISIKNCDIESVRRHLNNSAQNNGFSQLFDSHDSEGRTSLHIAAFYGYQEICEVLIENGAPVNAQDFQNNIPIHLAVLKNQINVVELLLNNGSLLDSVNDKGSAPLHFAAKNKNKEIVDMLCATGADPNIINKQGCTPVNNAAIAGWFEGLTTLVGYGGKIEMPGTKMAPILIPPVESYTNEIKQDEYAQIIGFLVDKGADILSCNNPKDASAKLSKGSTPQNQFSFKCPLILALNYGDPKLLRILLKKKVSLNKLLPNGKLPFEYAIERTCSNEILNILMENGADIHRQDNEEKTYLHFATERKNSQAVKFLILNGVDPLIFDIHRNSPLFYAAKENDIELAKIFIQNGCDPEFKNKKLRSPLTIASKELGKIMSDEIIKPGVEDTIKKANQKIQANDSKIIKEKVHQNQLEVSKSTKKFSLTVTTTPQSKKIKTQANVSQARPWGGSVESEFFKRKVRLQLNDLRKEMNKKLEELKLEVEELKTQIDDNE